MFYKLSKPGLLILITAFFHSLTVQAESQLTQWQTADYIEKAFIEIALKSEFRQTDLKVVKWQAPIAYRFEYHGTTSNEMIENLFRAHFDHLQSITQHTINLSSSKAKSNLTIVLTQDRYYKADIRKLTDSTVPELERNSNCIASFNTDSKGNIQQGVVILPVDHVMSKGLLPACVVEETTQLMGLPNDSDWVNPSIANDSSKLDLLTGLDYILLKILYSPDLKAGMPLDRSLPIIRKRIQRLFKDGTVEDAPRAVNRQGLYPLLY